MDCLKKEEITGIFVDAIAAIIQGDTPTLNLDKNESAEEEDIDYSEDDGAYMSEDSYIPEVTLGCKVVVRDKNKTTKSYKYDLLNGKLPMTVEIFTGHKIGDYVEIEGEQWIIEDVIIELLFDITLLIEELSPKRVASQVIVYTLRGKSKISH